VDFSFRDVAESLYAAINDVFLRLRRAERSLILEDRRFSADKLLRHIKNCRQVVAVPVPASLVESAEEKSSVRGRFRSFRGDSRYMTCVEYLAILHSAFCEDVAQFLEAADDITSVELLSEIRLTLSALQEYPHDELLNIGESADALLRSTSQEAAEWNAAEEKEARRLIDSGKVTTAKALQEMLSVNRTKAQSLFRAITGKEKRRYCTE